MDKTGGTLQQTPEHSDTKPVDNGAGTLPENAPSLTRQIWDAIRDSRLLAKIILILVVLLVVFIAWRAMKTPQWIFSIKAETGIIELVTPDNGETRWRVNDAVICSRGALQADTGQDPLQRVTDTSCGSAAWSGYRFPDPEQTLVLTGVFDVMLEARRDGALFLALRDRRIPPGQAAPGDSERASVKPVAGPPLLCPDSVPGCAG